jgi:hypothetical protein
MEITSLGLWLIGVGALGAIVEALLTPPSQGAGGLGFASPEAAQPARIRHAIRLVAAVLVAIGSALVAASELPAWWIAPLTALVALAGIWLGCAWSQHRVWVSQLAEAERAPPADRAEYPMMERRVQCARHCARARWALWHPFNGKTWPRDFERRHPRDE